MPTCIPVHTALSLGHVCPTIHCNPREQLGMADKPKQSKTDLSNLPEDALIRLPDVLRLYPVSKSKWWDGVRTGTYPRPVELGPRARAWRLGEVLALTHRNTTT
jgi:predicted DNA-binding transcriptional regulator AlpA